MATRTNFLQLTLPLNNEFQNIWDSPLNANLTAIDAFAESISSEITAARGSQPDLATFLQQGHNQDGSLKATPEVVAARVSFSYGDGDTSGDFSLAQRLNLGDREVFDAREGAPSLRSAIAARFGSMVLSGSKDVNGNPTWLGSTGANAIVDGSVTNILFLIGGFKARIRTSKTIPITGSAQTMYLWAQSQGGGQTTVDGDSTTPPPNAPNGVTTTDGSKITIFNDSTIDFTTKDVQVGDILRILGTNANAGDYLVKTVAPGGNANQLQIIGVFPGGSIAALNYVVLDPLAVTVGFDTSRTPANGKFYIGEADFDGSSVTAVRPRCFNNEYMSEWRAIDVSGGAPTFEEIFNHFMGDDKLDIVIQASTANDGSTPVEELSTAGLSNTLSLNFSNTLSFDPGTFNPGSSGATYSPAPSLSGGVTSSLNGSIHLDRSVAVKYTRNQIFVKNATSAVFFKDYNGTIQQTGYIRVLIKKRG